MNHPDKLINFAAWGEGEELLGVVDATLPNMTPLKETTKGAGIAGEMETGVPGHYGSMKLQVTWKQATPQALKLARPEGMTIELRAAAQGLDSSTYKFTKSPIRVTVRASRSDLQLGKFDPATAMGTTTEIECLYFKYMYGDEIIFENDKLNFKSVVLNEDELEEVNRMLGR